MKKISLFALAAAVVASSLPAAAQISLITSRAAFPTDDTVNWATLGPAFTQIASPFTATTIGGNSITVSHNENTLFERRDQSTGGWGGNFSSGDALLWNRGNNGPMTFDPAALISGAGFNVQSDYPGAFVFRLDAFAVGGGLLGSVTLNGVADQNLGTAIFIGFTSASLNVDKFIATLVQATGGPSDFAINTLALAGSDGSFPPNTAVPEPSAYAFFGVLALLASVGGRRRFFKGRGQPRPAAVPSRGCR